MLKATMGGVLVAVAVGCAAPLPPMPPQLTPMERANTILVRTTVDPSAAYQSLVRRLVSEGYALASSNNAARTATTGWANRAPWNGAMRIMVAVLESEQGAEIVLRGQQRANAWENVLLTIERKGANRSPARMAWRELDRLASLLAGEIFYARR